jgi:ribosomal protein L29
MKDALNITKLKTASTDEIDARVMELKKDLMDKRFALSVGNLKDTSSVSKARRAIAALKGFASNKPKAKAAKAKATKTEGRN